MSHKFVSERVQVKVYGEMFDVQVHELGIGSLSIVDDSFDTSFNIDVNDIEKVILLKTICDQSQVHMEEEDSKALHSSKSQVHMEEEDSKALHSSKAGESSV
nr:RNA-directed DNA polymerase, eukaryota, nucleotide-binding alpha-beta plait domain protein [Tanacetum cinerariifolium]